MVWRSLLQDLTNEESSTNITDAAPPEELSAQSIMDIILSWQCALLYIMFVVITLVWEYSTALLSFITIRLSGRRALWLQRLKGEVLALGIITLVLEVAQRGLVQICVHGTPHEGDADVCPPGQAPLFTAEMIHYTHYLLFETAVMHIIVTSGSFYLCLARMRCWRKWERSARMGYCLELEEAELLRDLGGSRFTHAVRSVFSTVRTNVNEPLYNLLRMLFKIRIDDQASKPKDQLPLNFNFLNIVEQAFEVEFVRASGYMSVLFFFTAVFMVIPNIAQPIYFLSLLAIVILFIVSAKYQSIIVQLSAITLFDFFDEVKQMQQGSHTGRLQRISTKAQLDLMSSVGSAVSLPLSLRLAKLNSAARPGLSSPAEALAKINSAGRPGVMISSEGLAKLGSGARPAAVPGAEDLVKEPPGTRSGAVQPAAEKLAKAPSGVPPSQSGEGFATVHSVLGPPPASQEPSGRVGVSAAARAGVYGLTRISAALKAGMGGPAGAAPVGKPVLRRSEVLPRELEAMRSRLKFHLRDHSRPGHKLKRSCKELFWFGSPAFLLGLFQLSMLAIALALALLTFGLMFDGTNFVESGQGLGLFIPCMVVDFLALLYAAMFVQPAAALVNTAGSHHPSLMMKEIKVMKLVSEEDWEEGIGGFLLKMCLAAEAEEEHGDIDTLEATHAFISMLADQAGVIAAKHNPASGSGWDQVKDMNREFARMWIQRCEDWAEGREPPEEGYIVSCDLKMVCEAFKLIDTNHSNAISGSELAAVLKVMGTRATAEEVQDMVHEIDVDCTDRIELPEFFMFMVFKFFNLENDGSLDEEDIAISLETLGLGRHDDGLAKQLLDFCLEQRRNKKDMRPCIHLADFIHTFVQTRLFDTDKGEYVIMTPPERTSAATVNSIKLRAWDHGIAVPLQVLKSQASQMGSRIMRSAHWSYGRRGDSGRETPFGSAGRRSRARSETLRLPSGARRSLPGSETRQVHERGSASRFSQADSESLRTSDRSSMRSNPQQLSSGPLPMLSVEVVSCGAQQGKQVGNKGPQSISNEIS